VWSLPGSAARYNTALFGTSTFFHLTTLLRGLLKTMIMLPRVCFLVSSAQKDTLIVSCGLVV
jgi:hypothetical protein